ncbi:predicted protein [Naegleria gruberi]|uniref:Predicted protein n=1 Tax=Naegleria gruberi TaxID=5762 RepID=D2VY28_NAEGR|nr:uncharacterized protein NAEGRDRAFT_81664 [Naegleria gruberi]EFC38292.1 predicted protein [Naegleria gruberi]|eukprot:XP_002671036.1 predicted protein [Naegleria gruberi strain NEG-M]
MGNKHVNCHHEESNEQISNLMKHYGHYSIEQNGGISDSNSADEISSNLIVKHHSLLIDEIERSNPTLWRHYTVQYYIKTRFDANTSSLDTFLNQMSKSTLKEIEREFKTALLQHRLSKYHFPNHPNHEEKNDALHVTFIEDFFDSTFPSHAHSIKQKHKL